MSSTYEQLDEILGVSFGDALPKGDSVLADFHVRAGGREGTRGNLLIHRDVLAGLIAGLPEVMEAMREDGADREVLPAAARPVPAWNAGPRWDPAGASMHVCMGIGVRAVAPEVGAAVFVIQTASPAARRGEADSQDYLMGWKALQELQAALPKVLRRLERRATTNRRS